MTKQPAYAVPDSPFSIPVKLGRYGLSEVINHLLELESQVPFDFLITGVLLRQSLLKFCQQHKVSSENILEIEYFAALTLSDESQTTELPAWIGCVDVSSQIVAGCYDGQVRLLGLDSLEVSHAFQAHEAPIRDVVHLNPNLVATASKDQVVKIWSLGHNQEKLHANLEGHTNSVESLAYWSNRNILLSGDWNGTVFGWNVSSMHSIGEAQDSDKSSKKKRKTSKETTVADETSVVSLQPIFTIKGHAQSISGIEVFSNENAYTSSWDHTIKKWDLERQDCISTSAASKVVTCLSSAPLLAGQHVMTGHPDGRLRLWDFRTQTSNCKVVYGLKDIHWVSDVKWHPTNEFVFASTDYNGGVYVWDTRGEVPIGFNDAHSGKGLCVDWIAGRDGATDKVISGGSDCCIKSLTFA